MRIMSLQKTVSFIHLPVLSPGAEILEYAKWLGMDEQDDAHLFWIAREGLKALSLLLICVLSQSYHQAPLPEHWKPCKTQVSPADSLAHSALLLGRMERFITSISQVGNLSGITHATSFTARRTRMRS